MLPDVRDLLPDRRFSASAMKLSAENGDNFALVFVVVYATDSVVVVLAGIVVVGN